MKALRAHYENGAVKLDEIPEISEPAEVLVIFPEPDPWEAIESDTSRRPALEAAMQKALDDHAAGLTTPLEF